MNKQHILMLISFCTISIPHLGMATQSHLLKKQLAKLSGKSGREAIQTFNEQIYAGQAHKRYLKKQSSQMCPSIRVIQQVIALAGRPTS